MHLSIETPTHPTPGKYGALMGVTKDFGTFMCPRGWGISKVLTFVDERGLRQVIRIHALSHPQRRFQDGRH